MKKNTSNKNVAFDAMQETRWCFYKNAKALPLKLSDQIKQTIKEEKQKDNELKVLIATDSAEKKASIRGASDGGKVYEYYMVIVFIRERKGGFMYIKKQRYHYPLGIDIKTRMIKEMKLTMKIARELRPILDKAEVPYEIHVDINPDESFKSNEAMMEAIQLAIKEGFDPYVKYKPEAYGSSRIADKHGRHSNSMSWEKTILVQSA